MTQEVTIEQMNEAIARFMGGESKTVNIGGVKTERFYMPNSHITDYVSDFSYLDYHSSWNALMPVVQKIGNMSASNIELNKRYKDLVNIGLSSLNIELIHKFVYDYIECFCQQSGREAGEL